MKTTATLLVQICLLLLVAVPAGYASQDNARAVKIISDLKHGGGRVGTYHALLVGINNYKDPGIPDLDTPVNDVNEMEILLKNKYGFKVTILINQSASKKGIYDALRTLVSKAKPEDSVLIYFAGHGDYDRLTDGGWWIPWDAGQGDSFSYLDNVLTQKLIAGMKARHVLLISDSCYSGTLFGKARALPPVITDKYYLELFNEKSRWGMTSGNFTPVSDSGTGGHSIFAYQLLKALKKNSKPYLSTQELYTGFARIVANNSDQTPMCRPIKSTGDQGGEFVFIMAGGPGPEPDIPAPPAAKKGSWLSVEANVAGADVLVDGRFVGKTPLRDYEIAPGDHRITVTSQGYGNYERTYTFRSGRSRDVNVLLAEARPVNGSLTVDTVPGDAVVKIMNIREKYHRGIELAPGKYHVRLLASGYDSQSLWTEVGQGEDKTIAVHLKKTAVIAPAQPPVSVAPPAPRHPEPGATWTEPVTGMEFVWVPGGCFDMGDTFGDGDYDEKPVHEVCVGGFWMGKYEVTQAQYRKVTGSSPSYFNGDRRPVELVSWHDAQGFINKLTQQTGKRFSLPTEAQWEYAARSRGKRQKYSGGSSAGSVAWYRDNSGGKTQHVGTKSPNGLGLYDMSGNVWEWCRDAYDKHAYSKHSRNNPVITSGSSRVLRGGSWYDGPGGVRCGNRGGFDPSGRYCGYGFRLVLPGHK